jgi:hypothetical protein
VLAMRLSNIGLLIDGLTRLYTFSVVLDSAFVLAEEDVQLHNK